MLISALLLAVSPIAAHPFERPAEQTAVTCKVIKDHPLKSRRITACGTKAEWNAYRTAIQKRERASINVTQSSAGVGSGS